MKEELVITQLKTLQSKLNVEKAVFPSLQHEKLTKDKINTFVELMVGAYNYNIDIIQKSIDILEEEVEKKNKRKKTTKKDGK